ncbi:uncharacterized protein Art8 [Epargyreus clarus]|uniref:uncharacterized protein Art8 n=1 Tax=Epargyreus clarus TaxID=520877 RepID=UPI003C2CFE9C
MEVVQNEYFSSYEDLEVHRLMLEDSPRTEAYKKAIFNNKSYFANKVVMDIGCGTGILSVFCAQAGAQKVFAVEASEVANIAKEVVKENNFDNVIEVIHSKVEDVVLPNNMKVDIIVSEWMGFYLLHEGMLDSVIVARDKFLKENGVMFPESAVIYVAPCSVPTLYDKWRDLYGVSLSTFAAHLRKSKSDKPEIMQIKANDLLADEVALCWVDLKEDKVSDLDSYSIQHVIGARKDAKYQGICVWFECNFPKLTSGDGERVVLSTGPESEQTHWKQTVIMLPAEQEVVEGEPIAFQLDMKRDKMNSRRYNLELTLLDPDTADHPIPCNCYMTKCILIKTVMSQQNREPLNQSNTSGQSQDILEDDDIDDDEDVL